MEKTYLTSDGYKKLENDLQFMKTTRRHEIARHLEFARSFGDLRENAEFEAAKQELTFNEIRIRELEDKLARVEIINNQHAPADRVFAGCRIGVRDLDTNEITEYELVGTDEADPVADRISISSPVGKALIGHRIEDTVEIKVPKGVLRYQITSISRI
jgi:transcription elongation factor GreA